MYNLGHIFVMKKQAHKLIFFNDDNVGEEDLKGQCHEMVI
jgi:hypothetical protein